MSQPTFPTDHAPHLPQMLHWWNPRHYPRLLGWLFFQPSQLYQYLWRADSQLYRAAGLPGLFHIVRQPAYRHLWLMMPVLAVLMAGGLAAPFSLFFPLDWGEVVTNTAVGVAVGVAVGAAVGMAFGVAAGTVIGVALGATLGAALGVEGGLATGIALGVVVGMALSLVGGVAYGLAVSVALGVAYGVAGGLAVGVGWVIGSGRLLPFFPFALVSGRHPVRWDELLVLPVPRTQRFLCRTLEEGAEGFKLVARVAANPYQRGHAQRALAEHLHRVADPLALLGRLNDDRHLDESYREPVRQVDFGALVSRKCLLLAELAQQFPHPDANERLPEQIAWRLTRWQRHWQPSPLVSFCALLAVLHRQQEAIAEMSPTAIVETLLPQEAYRPLADYPHGRELVQRFDLLRHYLAIESLPQLAQAPSPAPLPEPTLRPAVGRVLRVLGEVAQQTAALPVAAERLAVLEREVADAVWPPERALLLRVIALWQGIVATA